jgi:hypothetical protein
MPHRRTPFRPAPLIGLVAILALAALPASRAQAQAAGPPPATTLATTLTGAAKSDYDAARVLFSGRDYAGAEVKFASAYERSRDARLLYNMAACEKSLKHYARAIDLLRRYEADGKGVLSAADVDEADRLTETFRSFVGGVRVSSSEAGATVTVDDEEVGTTPLPKNLALDLGDHRLRVSKRGFVPFETRVTIQGPSLLAVEAALSREVHEGVVTIHAGAGDAIAVDGKIVATADWTAHLPAGAHTLTVTADGMRTFQSDLFVEDGKARSLDVTLEPLPRRGVPAWILVTGGVVLTTGAAVAAAAVYRSYSPLQQKPTAGTTSPGYTQTAWRFP